MKPCTSPLPSLRSLLWRGRVLLLTTLGIVSLWGEPTLVCAQAKAPAQAPAPAVVQPPNTLLLLQQIEEGLAMIVKEVNRSVVTIEGRSMRKLESGQTTAGIAVLRSEEGFQKDRPKPNEEKSRPDTELLQFLGTGIGGSSAGSGFMIESGYIVTTSEVANRIKEPVVVLAGGERVPAVLVKADKESNIALLKLSRLPDGGGLKWGDSDKVQPGYFAITLGNQGGFANSISLGLIAGRGRNGKSGEIRYNDLIQFQGIVGKGGSGSPLINAHGEVIGMVVATPSIQLLIQEEQKGEEKRGFSTIATGFSNVGFAIPSNDIRRVVDLLKKKSYIAKMGWLGVNLLTGMEEILKQPAKITGIYSGGPADRAGLRFGDVITMVNGVKVSNTSELRAQLRKLGAGEALRITLLREGKILTLTATIEPRPDDGEILRMRVITEPDAGN
ncbi:MAG: trypsin-like peptidase domain-containing protein [Armatimonadetes bacterium]|nr:trypsin-like peptidase domain-containing protein [Armatimonadota bacterium]